MFLASVAWFRGLGFVLLAVALSFSSGSHNLMSLLKRELRTNFAELKKQDSLPPYFLAYRLNDTASISYSVNRGGVVSNRRKSGRALSVEIRVGTPSFDNTHPLRENLDFTQWGGFQNEPWPQEFNPTYFKKSLRVASDFAYREARDQFSKIRANVGVRPAAGDTGLDFSSSLPSRSLSNPASKLPESPALDSLYARLRRVSKLFSGSKFLYGSQIDFRYSIVLKRLVTTGGTALEYPETLGNISLYVETKALDGMVLWLARDFAFRVLPLDFSEDTLAFAARQLMERLDTLRMAPVMETYSGPAILMNTAAGVFIHEVFGHRVEGHRQKAVEEGQTFVSKVGQKISAPFISVTDDPTLSVIQDEPLNGYYRFDDEGVPAQRTTLIQNGVFRDFLFSRSVLSTKGKSNGHGRAMLGYPVVARMGNTMVTATGGIPFAALRDSLRARLRAEGKPFGLLLHDISGGFTYTTRDLPQSFRVEPLYVQRIFADGRPDQVVRGVDAVGTPLSSLGQIVAVGNDPAVFNGHCGAESGWIPVSAVSPSLLLASMEFESRAKDQNLPPILPPPGVGP